MMNTPYREGRDDHGTQATDLAQALLYSSPDGVYVLDSYRDSSGEITDFRIVLGNESATRLTGIASESLQGKLLCETFACVREDGVFDRYMEVIQTGKPQRFTYQYPDKTDPHEDHWLSVAATPYQKSGLLVTFSDITSLMCAERDANAARECLELATRENQQLALAVSQASCGLVMTDESRCIRWCNQAFLDLSGYTQEEVMGRKPGAFLQGSLTNLETVFEMRQALNAWQPFSGELLNYRKDGTTYWVEISIQPILDEQGNLQQFIAAQLNITQRKQAENHLRESEALFRSLADNVPVLIWMSDAQMYAFYFSKPWLAFTGKSQTDQVGLRWISGVHPDEREFVLERYRRCNMGQCAFETDFRFRRSDGVYRWMQARAVPRFSTEGVFEGFVGTCVDIDDRKQAADAFREANEQAQMVSRAKSEFLAVVSHELRTPLSPILGMTSLLLDSVAEESELGEALALIEASAQHLNSLIGDLLELSQIQTDRIHLRTDLVSLYTLCHDLHEMFAPIAQKKDIELAVVVDNALPEFVETDQQRLHMILRHTLGNAIKFTNSGKVTLEVSQLSCEDKMVNVGIRVWDTGSGISKKDLEHIFESFTQGDSSHTRSHGGLGVGLAIVNPLCHLLGGVMNIESVPGEGTDIEFRFTFRALEDEPEQSIPPQEIDRSMRVLVVEDDALNRMVLFSLLRHFGLSYDWVGNGRECCERVAQSQYDLILLDLNMPVMNGLDCLKQLHAYWNKQQVKVRPHVCVVTAGEGHVRQEHYLKEGMDDCLIKPVSLATMRQLLEKATYSRNKKA